MPGQGARLIKVSACAAVMTAAFMAAALLTSTSASAADERSRYVKTPTGYLMVLRQGDDVFAELTKLTDRERIPSAGLAGIGFLRTATFGFYDFEKKRFEPKTFTDVEMASLTGSIAWADGKPSIHAHAAVTDRTFAAFGGHALKLEVGTGSVEITVSVHDAKLDRQIDPQIGANILQLD